MKRELTCIICPRGCQISVTKNDENLDVVRNTCQKGKKYAIEECTHPMRTVTSSIRVSNRENTMVSVKTDDAVPKEKIFEVMEKIRNTQISAPVKIEDKILFGVCGTFVVATKNIK